MWETPLGIAAYAALVLGERDGSGGARHLAWHLGLAVGGVWVATFKEHAGAMWIPPALAAMLLGLGAVLFVAVCVLPLSAWLAQGRRGGLRGLLRQGPLF